MKFILHPRVCLLAIGLVAANCGGPGAFDGENYRDASVSFRVPHFPSEWRPIRVSDAKLAFRDDAKDASILVTARCGVASDDVPLASLTQQLVMGTTAREYLSDDLISLDGREALHTIMRAKLDGVLMQYNLYVMKKNGCVYDFIYVAPPDKFAAGAAAFETFATGFRTVGPT